MMDTGHITCCSCSHSDFAEEGLCYGCGHGRVLCTNCGNLGVETKVVEEASNLATLTKKMATFARPESSKIPHETAKKLQVQQNRHNNQLKNMDSVISKKAEVRAKTAKFDNSLESRLREDRARNEAEHSVEMAKSIGEEEAKAEAELETAQNAKEIADAEGKLKAAKAKIDAGAEAALAKVPSSKAKPIKFKDALGRKFHFPYEMCRTWEGMNDLICQAFAHIEPIGQMVADGNYDLVGPYGEIILPQFWEMVLEPDWTVTMHMWPVKEVPTAKGPPPGMTMRHTFHPTGKSGGSASRSYTGREREGQQPPPPAQPPNIWIGPLSGGSSKISANKPRRKAGTSGWGSLFTGTPRKATRKKKNEDILQSPIPSRSNPGASLQWGLSRIHDRDDDTSGFFLLHSQRLPSFHSPSEEQQTLSGNPSTLPQLAESSYPLVSEFRVTEYTEQQEAEAEAEAERQKQQALEEIVIKPSDASFIQTAAHRDAEKKQSATKHDQKAQNLGGRLDSLNASLKQPDSDSDGVKPEVEEVEQQEQTKYVTCLIEASDAPPEPVVIYTTRDKDHPQTEQEKQAELLEDNVEAWDESQTLLPPTDNHGDEKRQVPRTEKQTGYARDSIEPPVAPPTPPASDSDDRFKEHLADWTTPPPTYVPLEVVLPLPCEIPLPLSPPLTPARTSSPPPALPPLRPASMQSPTSPFGPRLLYAGRDGTRVYAPYHYEQFNPPQQERSPLAVVWAVVFCLSLGTISLVILTFGATTSLIDERTAPPTPSTSDAEFSLALQSSLWAITNLIAGLIPACMHATRYRKWLRMNYAWLPAVVCLVMVVASVPIYLRSPALSNGLTGVANIPMGLFIFFASWEAIREEGRGKCGCAGKAKSEMGSGSCKDMLLRKDSGLELRSLG